MTSLKEKGKEFAAKLGAVPDTCGVRWCKRGDAELVELLPLDPIDHDSTLIQLCTEHQEWADQRNDLAAEVADELREKRREIGDRKFDEIQELAVPQGAMHEDILNGDVADGQLIPLEAALEVDE